MRWFAAVGKAKRRAAQQARDTAAELLNPLCQRAAPAGPPSPSRHTTTMPFADGFGFEETADQANAIAAVIEDMKPASRWTAVCGDVGFGKTEVALRAAFVRAGGKQVAVLCPTTLLCRTALSDLLRPLCRTGRSIAELSRFKTAKESALAMKELSEGKRRRHHHRHAPPAPGNQVRPSRAGDHRRGAPLRRAQKEALKRCAPRSTC